MQTFYYFFMQLSDHTLTALFTYSLMKYDDALFLSYVDVPRIAGDYLASFRKTVNSRLNIFSRISGILDQKESFEKTPTNKIKRYIYTALQGGPEKGGLDSRYSRSGSEERDSNGSRDIHRNRESQGGRSSGNRRGIHGRGSRNNLDNRKPPVKS